MEKVDTVTRFVYSINAEVLPVDSNAGAGYWMNWLFGTKERQDFVFMRNIKIVADSSANLLQLEKTAFAVAPLKVIAGDMEFVDNEALDASGMTAWFDT